MNIFKEVKDRVTAREVASAYGLSISKKGMACCPFHADKHPSMKIEQGYYCFACGAKGDAIGYVAQLFGLSQYDAAVKIIQDFHLTIDFKQPMDRQQFVLFLQFQREQKEKAKMQRTINAFKKWRLSQIDQMHRIKSDISTIRQYFQNSPPEIVYASSDYHLAIMTEPLIDYWLDILCMGSIEDQKQFFIKNRKGVETRGKQIKRAVQNLMG